MLLEAQRKSHSKISTMGGQKEDKQSRHRERVFTGEAQVWFDVKGRMLFRYLFFTLNRN